MKTIFDLEKCFDNAIENGDGVVAVEIKMQGFPRSEIIINQVGNYEKKLEYYQKAYNEDLTLKTFNGIQIVNFVSGRNFTELQKKLMW